MSTRLIGGGVLGGAAGYAAGRMMNKSKKDRLYKLKEKALKEQEELKGVKDKRTALKLKSGLTVGDLNKIKDHKKAIAKLKKGKFTKEERDKVEDLKSKIFKLQAVNKSKDLVLQRDTKLGALAGGAADLGTSLQTDTYQREIRKIKADAIVRGQKDAKEKLKKIRTIESKMKLSSSDMKEYKDLKARLKKGNLNQKEANKLKSKINNISGISTLGGLLLGAGLGAKLQNDKNKKDFDSMLTRKYRANRGM